jgi:hypothetical protein
MATLKDLLGIINQHGGTASEVLGTAAELIEEHAEGLTTLAKGVRMASEGAKMLADTSGAQKRRVGQKTAHRREFYDNVPTSGAQPPVRVTAREVPHESAPAAKRRRKVEGQVPRAETTIVKATVGTPDSNAWRKHLPKVGG